jgi:hypothetical protein
MPLRRIPIAFVLPLVTGCGAPRQPALSTTGRLGPAATRCAPEPTIVARLFPSAGRHAVHEEEDVGPVEFDGEGAFVVGPHPARRWRISPGYPFDSWLPGGPLIPGFSIELRRRRHAVSIIIPGRAYDHSEYDDMYFSSGISLFNVWRVQYRHYDGRAHQYWLAGIAQMARDGRSYDWTYGGEETDHRAEALYGSAGIGWRQPWTAGARVSSSFSLEVLLGPGIPPAVDYLPLEDDQVGIPPVLANLGLTLLAVDF